MSTILPIANESTTATSSFLGRRVQSHNDLTLPVTLPKAKQSVSMPVQSTYPSTNSLKSCFHSSDDDSAASSGVKKSVSFNTLTIREYSQIPDINPSVSSGPPIGLGWDFEVLGSVDISKYEELRPPRRIRSELNIPAAMRQKMLREDFSLADVNRATKLSNVGRSQRRSTSALQEMEGTQIFMESATRKIKRWVKGKTTRAEQEELWLAAQTHKREQLDVSVSSKASSDFGIGLHDISEDPAYGR